VAAVRNAVRAALADLAPFDLALVACSGGADSLALAAAAGFLGPGMGLRVAGLTVDHQLQPGSAERAEGVAGQLRRIGLDPVEVITVQVGAGGGPEAAARAARYAALDAGADRLGAAAVLLGHTADDQAETVLLGLARGSGPRSLAGMAAVAGRYRRPLLDLTRSTTRAACAAGGLEIWDDPHNADPAYARARVRTLALPALEAALGPGVGAALARTARLLRADSEALDTLAVRAAATCTRADGLDCAALAELPEAVRARVLRNLALAAGCPGGSLAAAHIEALDRLITGHGRPGPVHLPGRIRAHRRCGTLVLSRTHEE